MQFLVDTKKVKTITKEILVENGIVSKNDLVKILGRGELKAKLDVTVDSFSASAKAAIEKAGGKVTALYVSKKASVQEEAAPKKAAAPKADKKVEEVKAEAKEEIKEEKQKMLLLNQKKRKNLKKTIHQKLRKIKK